jgi:hypothetical protein
MMSSLAFIYIARHRQVFTDIADTPDALDYGSPDTHAPLVSVTHP